MNHHKTNHRPQLQLVPAEILDPYPERATNETGVRQHTHPDQPTGPKCANQLASHRPPPSFTASLKPGQRPTRRTRVPVASLTVTLAGQAALGATMTLSSVNPAISATAAVAWMIAGLAVIVCQCLSQATATNRNVERETVHNFALVGAVGEAEDGPQGRPQVRATYAPALGNGETSSPHERTVTTWQ